MLNIDELNLSLWVNLRILITVKIILDMLKINCSFSYVSNSTYPYLQYIILIYFGLLGTPLHINSIN